MTSKPAAEQCSTSAKALLQDSSGHTLLPLPEIPGQVGKEAQKHKLFQPGTLEGNSQSLVHQAVVDLRACVVLMSKARHGSGMSCRVERNLTYLDQNQPNSPYAVTLHCARVKTVSAPWTNSGGLPKLQAPGPAEIRGSRRRVVSRAPVALRTGARGGL